MQEEEAYFPRVPIQDSRLPQTVLLLVAAMSFKALKVWRALKRKPGMALGEIASDIGWLPSSVSQMLIRLHRDGSATRKGPRHSYRWWATDQVPVDGRGLAKGSFEALVAFCPQWQDRLEKAKIAKPRKVVPKPKPAIALEQFWPMSVRSRADSTDDSDSCSNYAREDAP